VAQEGNIDGLVVDAFINAPDVSDGGTFVYRGQAGGTSAAFEGSTAIAVEGNSIPAYTGRNYNTMNNPTITDDGSAVHMVTSFTDGDGFGGSALLTNSGTNTVAQADFSGPGVIDASFTTTIDGETIGNAADIDYSFSSDGSQFVLPVSLFGVSPATNTTLAVGTFDGSTASVAAALADGVVMREDNSLAPSSLNGRTISGAEWGSFGDTAIANDGTFLVTGNLDGGEDFLAIDGVLELADGDALAGGILQDIDAAEMDDNGNWAAIVEVLMPDTSTQQALVYNGNVLLENGDLVLVDSVAEMITSFATGDDVLGLTNANGTESDIFFLANTASGESLFSVSSTASQVIPLPAPVVMAGALLAGVAIRRRRTRNA